MHGIIKKPDCFYSRVMLFAEFKKNQDTKCELFQNCFNDENDLKIEFLDKKNKTSPNDIKEF